MLVILDGSTGGELITELMRHGLQELTELQVLSHSALIAMNDQRSV